jgi:Phosphotransferase enzyme family
MPQPIEITPENARTYLIDRGVIAPHAQTMVEPLGWGISNIVLKVIIDDDVFVMKQSLPKLRVKDDWPFDRDRILLERDCMTVLGDLLPAGTVPTVRFSDDENFVFGMSCAPAGGVFWKEALLDGRVDEEAAARAGQWLADMHALPARHPEVAQRFAGVNNFIQGRVDPYHRTAARVNPDLAGMVEAEVGRMLQVRVALVHGDYSPKNLFLYPDHVLVIDFEVAHVGDPAFDTAFLLNHLILKAIRRPELLELYLAAAKRFWRAYIDRINLPTSYDVEAATVRELGCLLLARIDGKSKIEYITDEGRRGFTRDLARSILVGRATTINPVIDDLGDSIASLRER